MLLVGINLVNWEMEKQLIKLSQHQLNFLRINLLINSILLGIIRLYIQVFYINLIIRIRKTLWIWDGKLWTTWKQGEKEL